MSSVKNFLKAPEKIRDWSIAIFLIWAMLTGGLSGKDLLNMIKGDKDDKPTQVSPGLIPLIP